VREWRQRDYQKPVLERAALVAAARKGDWTKLPEMLAYLGRADREEVQSVALVRLLAGCPAAEKWPVLRQLAEYPAPWVRASAVEALGENLEPATAAILLKAIHDDYRLVRVRAAAALARVPEERLPEEQRRGVRAAMAELMDSWNARPDDMESHYNLGNFHMARGQMPEAVTEFTTATRLQPEALPPYVNAALAYNLLGQNNQAEASLRCALRLDPTNAPANLNFGMLLAEKGNLPAAEQAFRVAFKAPPSAQAAYNLGVMLSKTHPAEALDWCRRAAALGPDNPQYGYTYAFYLHRAGQLDQALQVIRAVRARHPAHEDSALFERGLLQELKAARQK
jgi:tetratricopeptide (TPR) repeat protein